MVKSLCLPARLLLTLLLLMISAAAVGQAAQASPAASVAPGVPRLVKFNGLLKDSSGNLIANTVGVTFAVYSEQSGGVPLWQETQNVQFSQGRYTVFLGESTSAGIPAELFASGQPRWLGVKALLPGEEEQPRVLLASVPYALKAVDADTLGGLPASAFIQANGGNFSSVVVAQGSAADASIRSSLPSASKVTTSGGTAGTISQFDTPTDITNSPIVVNSSPTDLTDVVAMANLKVRNFENVRYADQFPGTGNHDIGDKINQAYSSCPSNGCKIKVAAGIYSFTTPISFSTLSKPVILEGDAGDTSTYSGYPPSQGTTEFYFTPTSGTAITMATGGGTGTGIRGITLFGPGFKGENAAVGLFITGEIRQTYKDLFISGFNVGLQIGSNVYLENFYNLQMLDNVKAIYTAPGLTRTGENMAFFGGVFTNKSTSLPGGGGKSVPFYPNCVDFEGGQGIVVSFYNISFDHCGVTVNIPGGQQFLFSGSHFENPNGPTTADFLTIGSNCVSCQVILSASDMLEDPPGSNRTEMISIDGGSRLVIVGGIYVAAEPLPQLITSTNNANAITVLGADKFNKITSWVSGSFAGMVTMNPREYQPLTLAGGPIILGSNPTIHGSIVSAPLSAAQTWAFPNQSGTVLVSTTGGNVTVPGNLSVAGNATVTGSLNVTGSKHFKIDDPLDPANKYLYHTSVESPDMMNIYNGTVVLDTKGEAEIQLPEWFEALNRDFRYQLTCIGGFAPVYVSREIENNTFRVAGGTSGLKLSWQVTGIRHDAYAEAHRSPVEVEKPIDERGHYLHPELFGASQDKAIGAH
jgi:hypothetical protein